MSGLDNSAVQYGVVKFFNEAKQYGFIIVDGEPDVFFYMTDGTMVEADPVTRGARFGTRSIALREPKAGEQLIFVPTKGKRGAAQKANPWGYAIEYEESLATLEPVFKPVDLVHKQAMEFVDMLMKQPASLWYDVYVTTLGLTRDQLIARELADRRLQDAFRSLNGDSHEERLDILARARIPLDIIVNVLANKCELSRSMYEAILQGYEPVLSPELLDMLQERVEQATKTVHFLLDVCDQYVQERQQQEADIVALREQLQIEDYDTPGYFVTCPHGGYWSKDPCFACQYGYM